ncbi:MAG: HAD-IA family hydrolase [Rhodoferax sp.]
MVVKIMEYGSKHVQGRANRGDTARTGSGVRALLFDLDGTLVDTLGDFVLALQAMLDEVAAAWARPGVHSGEVELLVGRGAEHLVQQILLQRSRQADSAPPAPELVQRAVQAYLAHYGRINGRHARAYADAAPALTRLRARGLRLVCVTNKPQGHAQALLQHLGLAPLLDGVVGAQEGLRKKPHPDALLLACRQSGVAPVQALMVGDSANDAQAARAAGCAVVLVDYGYNHGECVSAAGADAVLGSLLALEPYLDSLAV